VRAANQKAQEYFAQLVGTKENMDILKKEHQLLSGELTLKQSELHSSEKSKLALEREIIQLKPLKDKVSFSDDRVSK